MPTHGVSAYLVQYRFQSEITKKASARRELGIRDIAECKRDLDCLRRVRLIEQVAVNTTAQEADYSPLEEIDSLLEAPLGNEPEEVAGPGGYPAPTRPPSRGEAGNPNGLTDNRLTDPSGPTINEQRTNGLTENEQRTTSPTPGGVKTDPPKPAPCEQGNEASFEAKREAALVLMDEIARHEQKQEESSPDGQPDTRTQGLTPTSPTSPTDPDGGGHEVTESNPEPVPPSGGYSMSVKSTELSVSCNMPRDSPGGSRINRHHWEIGTQIMKALDMRLSPASDEGRSEIASFASFFARSDYSQEFIDRVIKEATRLGKMRAKYNPGQRARIWFSTARKIEAKQARASPG